MRRELGYPNEAEPSEEFPIYTRGNVGEAFPNVISPMSGSLMLDASTRSQTRFFLATGALSPRQVRDPRNAVFVQFGGYLYANVSMGRLAAVRAPGMSLDDLDAQYAGVGVLPPYAPRPGDRSLRATIRLTRFAARGFRRTDAARARVAQDEVRAWVDALAPVEAVDETELLHRVRSASRWFDRMLSEMMTVTLHAGSMRVVVERLAATSGEASLANAVTSGLGEVASAGPAIALWDLGRRVRDEPAVRAHFDRSSADLEDDLRADPACAEFVHAFDAFLQEYGFHGTDELELSSPKWGTDPILVLRIVDRLRHAPDARDPRATSRRLADERHAALVRLAATVRRPLRPLLRRAVHQAGRYAQEREATKAALVRALFESRRALDELAARHGLPREDVHLLLEDELEDALRDPEAFAEVLARRRVQRAELQARQPPFWFEGALPDPTTWPLRSTTAAVRAAPGMLQGLGVSGGSVTGRTRVILDPNDPVDLEPDEILVAPQTDPAWTPLFLGAAGVVVDVGAVMSHAAIVARELGIPAVVGLADATKILPTGTLVTLDGTTGSVLVHDT